MGASVGGFILVVVGVWYGARRQRKKDARWVGRVEWLFFFLFLTIGFLVFYKVFLSLEPAARGEVVMPGCDWLSAHVLLRVG